MKDSTIRVALKFQASASHGRSIALMKFLATSTRELGVARDTYIVGGAVRNFIMDPTGMHAPIKDLDVVIDSIGSGRDSAWLAKALTSRIPTSVDVTENQYGVSIITIRGEWQLDGYPMRGEVIEIANARTESYAPDTYKPDEVAPATIVDDTYRREFTFNCMTGDTLVPTENGILRIDEIANKVKGDRQDIAIKVAGREDPALAVGWQYSGNTETIRITTDWGHTFACTQHHPVLVLRGSEHDWVEAAQLQVGDLLCVNPRALTRQGPLALSLSDPAKPNTGKLKVVRKPTRMNPDLAFVLGCVVAEGSNTDKRVSFSNGDPALITRYVESFERVFGFEPTSHKVVSAGSLRVLKGVEFRANRDGFDLYADSKVVVGWLRELGLYCDGPRYGKSASHFKVVPWAILQADHESQQAFLAAYLECDGSIRSDTGIVTFCSVSPQIRQQLQVLLGAHGILSKIEDRFVRLTSVDSSMLWNAVKSFMVTKGFDYAGRTFKSRNRYGIPKDYMTGFLRGRCLTQGTDAAKYRTDTGDEIVLRGLPEIIRRPVMLLHDAYRRGDFDVLLAGIQQISPVEFHKLQKLFELGYQYVEVVSVEDAGMQDVYDISMGLGVEPAFVANGVIVHNTLLWRMHDLASGPDKAEILDLTGCGMKDLKDGIMRCPSDPDKTFGDDPSRMIRAIKFLLKYGFKIAPEVEASIKRNKEKIRNIPGGHLSTMLITLFYETGVGKRALIELDKLGILEVIRDIATKDKPFREALANWAERKADVAFLFDLMDLGMPVGKSMGFLNPYQKSRVREITVDMTADEGATFIAVLEQPGRVINMPGLIQEFGLKGAQIHDLMVVARTALLDDSVLVASPRRWESRIRTELAPQGKSAKTFTLNEGDPVFFGKYKNKRGLIRDFGVSDRGDPTVVIQPVTPLGRKQDQEINLFKIREDGGQKPGGPAPGSVDDLAKQQALVAPTGGEGLTADLAGHTPEYQRLTQEYNAMNRTASMTPDELDAGWNFSMDVIRYAGQVRSASLYERVAARYMESKSAGEWLKWIVQPFNILWKHHQEFVSGPVDDAMDAIFKELAPHLVKKLLQAEVHRDVDEFLRGALAGKAGIPFDEGSEEEDFQAGYSWGRAHPEDIIHGNLPIWMKRQVVQESIRDFSHRITEQIVVATLKKVWHTINPVETFKAIKHAIKKHGWKMGVFVACVELFEHFVLPGLLAWLFNDKRWLAAVELPFGEIVYTIVARIMGSIPDEVDKATEEGHLEWYEDTFGPIKMASRLEWADRHMPDVGESCSRATWGGAQYQGAVTGTNSIEFLQKYGGRPLGDKALKGIGAYKTAEGTNDDLNAYQDFSHHAITGSGTQVSPLESLQMTVTKIPSDRLWVSALIEAKLEGEPESIGYLEVGFWDAEAFVEEFPNSRTYALTYGEGNPNRYEILLDKWDNIMKDLGQAAASFVTVRYKWRRRGVATAMYAAAKQWLSLFGVHLSASRSQTPAGKGLWKGLGAQGRAEKIKGRWHLLAASKFKDKKEVKKQDGGTMTVYEYSDRQIAERNKAKAKQVEKLRGNIDKLRAQYRKDLTSEDEKTRNTALAVGLMDVTAERVGNDESAKDGHFGVTGWQKKHITFSGGKAVIKYVGKSGVDHVKEVTDAALLKALKAATKGKKDNDLICDGEDCSVGATDVNKYLAPFDVSAKDIRGFHANSEMQDRLKAARSKGGKLPTDAKEREKKLKDEFKQALAETAEAVGHEPSTLRSQYLVPGMESDFLSGGSVADSFMKSAALSWFVNYMFPYGCPDD